MWHSGRGRGWGFRKKVTQRRRSAAKKVRSLTQIFLHPVFMLDIIFAREYLLRHLFYNYQIKNIIIPLFCQPGTLIPVYLSICKSECTHRLIMQFLTFLHPSISDMIKQPHIKENFLLLPPIVPPLTEGRGGCRKNGKVRHVGEEEKIKCYFSSKVFLNDPLLKHSLRFQNLEKCLAVRLSGDIQSIKYNILKLVG